MLLDVLHLANSDFFLILKFINLTLHNIRLLTICNECN